MTYLQEKAVITLMPSVKTRTNELYVQNCISLKYSNCDCVTKYLYYNVLHTYYIC